MDTYTNMQQLISELEKDVSAFYEKGNASAGTRVRKRMMELKGLAQNLRVHVQSTKNDRKSENTSGKDKEGSTSPEKVAAVKTTEVVGETTESSLKSKSKGKVKSKARKAKVVSTSV